MERRAHSAPIIIVKQLFNRWGLKIQILKPHGKEH
jgi:hypothetical protein